MSDPIRMRAEYGDLMKLARRLEVAGRDTGAAIRRAHFRMGALVKDEAQLNAPETKEASLQNSIAFTATQDAAEVFVPSNSPAGAYAVRIHDERYKTWRNRGKMTKIKGARAREKFISRAISDNAGKLTMIISDTISKLLKGV